MTEIILLLASFAIILTGALVFTNAVEWAGHRLGLGEGAVGSLLAAVGTAMPETLIPIVAILKGGAGSEDVAIGAIIGAPFLLATIAMALVGISAVIYRNRRTQGLRLDVHRPTLERDVIFFLIFFAIALAIGIGAPEAVRIPAAIVFLLAYAFYVRMTLRNSGDAQEAEEIGPLLFDRRPEHLSGQDPNPAMHLVWLQLGVGLGAIVGGAHLFVEELIHVAESIGVSALVLSLVLAPLATELPEKANSFFWVREGKDSLAMGNITGAMVFQSTIPVAFGVALTSWDLDTYAMLSGILGLIGGLVVLFFVHRLGRFTAPAIAIFGLLYATFLGYVIFF